MYCPRCGSPNPDTTKFCRQCGLPMTPVTGYVASGGSGALTPPTQSPSTPALTEGMTPKQRMALTILFLVMSPAICGVLGGITGMGFLFGPLAGLSAVLMPIGIVWTIFRYKAQMRQMHLIGQQQQMQWQAPMPPHRQTPPLPYPQQQPIPPHISQPTSRVPTSQPPMPSPAPTNPLGDSPGSVTEDKTRRLPDQ